MIVGVFICGMCNRFCCTCISVFFVVVWSPALQINTLSRRNVMFYGIVSDFECAQAVQVWAVFLNFMLKKLVEYFSRIRAKERTHFRQISSADFNVSKPRAARGENTADVRSMWLDESEGKTVEGAVGSTISNSKKSVGWARMLLLASPIIGRCIGWF